jgi:hypothetical protein
MDCGAGTWGNIHQDVIDGTSTLFVRADYDGSLGASDGSSTRPWTTIQQAVNASAAGGVIAIAEGAYQESVEIASHAITLWGRCPEKVIVSAGSSANSTIDVKKSGTELHGLGVTGSALYAGISVVGASDVLIDRVRVFDHATQGILVQFNGAVTNATVQDSLIDGNHGIGIYGYQSTVTVAGSVIRSTKYRSADDMGGLGVVVQSLSATAPADLSLSRSVIDDNADIGLFVYGGSATVKGSVIQNTKPHPSYGEGGEGVLVQSRDNGDPGTLSLEDSVIDQNHFVGIGVSASNATVTRTVIRRTREQPSQKKGGPGISLESDGVSHGSTLVLDSSVIDDNLDSGLSVVGSSAQVRHSIIKNTGPYAKNQTLGRGVNAITDASGNTSSVTIEGSLIDSNHDIGVFGSGASVSLVDSVVSNTLPNASTNAGGEGIVVQLDDVGNTGSLAIERSRVDSNHTSGIHSLGCPVTVASSVIQNTQTQASDQGFGTGIECVAVNPQTPLSILIDNSLFDHNHYLSVEGLGAQIDIRSSSIRNTLLAGKGYEFGHGIGVDTDPARGVASLSLDGVLIENAISVGVVVGGATFSMSGSVIRGVIGDATRATTPHGVSIEALSTGERSTATISGSLIENVSGVGVGVYRCDASVINTVIQGIDAGRFDGLFGDATCALGSAHLTVEKSVLSRNQRAGLSAFGAVVDVSDVLFSCNIINLDQEAYEGEVPGSSKVSATLTNLGGNACMCDVTASICRAESQDLSPPLPVAPYAPTPVTP